MHNYSVNKYFGHFWQSYTIKAESEEDAWNRAEQDGRLQYQQVYREARDINSKGYVKDMDEATVNEPPITENQYYKWLREAIDKGMSVTPQEYEKALRCRVENMDINNYSGIEKYEYEKIEGYALLMEPISEIQFEIEYDNNDMKFEFNEHIGCFFSSSFGFRNFEGLKYPIYKATGIRKKLVKETKNGIYLIDMGPFGVTPPDKMIFHNKVGWNKLKSKICIVFPLIESKEEYKKVQMHGYDKFIRKKFVDRAKELNYTDDFIGRIIVTGVDNIEEKYQQINLLEEFGLESFLLNDIKKGC